MAFVLQQDRAKQYQIGQFLGKGGFASVYQVREKSTNTLYALKVVELNGKTGVRVGPGGIVALDDIEVELMQCLQKTSSTQTGFSHPNIIQLKEHWKQDDGEKLCMVLEFCADGALIDGIDEGKYLPDINRLIEHLIGALDFCEHHKVLHLDIKPDNVLVRDSPDGNIFKLADFGLAHYRCTMASQLMSAVGGTAQFQAPETTGKRKRITPKADVWATGVTLNWVVYKRFPFMNGTRPMGIVEIKEELDDDPDFLTIPQGLEAEGLSPKAIDVINRMVVVDVDRRASPSELAELLCLARPFTITVRSPMLRGITSEIRCSLG
jgi:serine/threonine protein kinase